MDELQQRLSEVHVATCLGPGSATQERRYGEFIQCYAETRPYLPDTVGGRGCADDMKALVEKLHGGADRLLKAAERIAAAGNAGAADGDVAAVRRAIEELETLRRRPEFIGETLRVMTLIEMTERVRRVEKAVSEPGRPPRDK